MALIFISYADEYFENILNSAIPEHWGGKFVHILSEDDEYLVFSPKGLTPYHADIVQRFCDERRLTGTFYKTQKRFDIEEPGWSVVGGGKFEFDRAAKTLRLHDNSMAYGRFEAKGWKEKIQSVRELSDYNIRID